MQLMSNTPKWPRSMSVEKPKKKHQHPSCFSTVKLKQFELIRTLAAGATMAFRPISLSTPVLTNAKLRWRAVAKASQEQAEGFNEGAV